MRDLLGLEGAYTPIILPSSGADFEMFEAWCADGGKPPLPAPRTVAAFVAERQNHAGATMRDPQNTPASTPASYDRERKGRHN
jgi:hypothetical protein